MNSSERFMILFGSIFASVGLLSFGIGIFLIFSEVEMFASFICIFLGLIFAAIGFSIIISNTKRIARRKRAEKNGKKYTGKIQGYVEDCSCLVNGQYLFNTKVHYFDEKGIEREAILPTGFVKGTGEYPIGATIDIVVDNTVCSWDKDSIRYEHIYREDELMDNKPLDPSKLNMTAVVCPNCGASFSAAKGYVGTCPYCSSVFNI